LDVHKSSISACILLREAGRVQKHQRRFGAMTQELQELAEWLRQFGVTQVAMESSGVYWKPVWNILERQFTIVLANAQHIKNVPGRKTDQKDAEWIAQLLQYGLLRASYVLCLATIQVAPRFISFNLNRGSTRWVRNSVLLVCAIPAQGRHFPRRSKSRENRFSEILSYAA
jgi:hypothetical protein